MEWTYYYFKLWYTKKLGGITYSKSNLTIGIVSHLLSIGRQKTDTNGVVGLSLTVSSL